MKKNHGISFCPGQLSPMSWHRIYRWSFALIAWFFTVFVLHDFSSYFPSLSFEKNSLKNHNPLENRYITSPGLTELLLKSNILSRSELIELKKKIEKR